MNTTHHTDLSDARRLPNLSKAMLLVLAVSCGMSVANLYYSQPLLADISQTFQTSARQMGIVSMLTQAGYALGLFLFVPLGDIKEKKFIIITLLGAVSIALLGVALAPNLTLLEIASFAVGTTTVVPQIIVPLAAQLANAKEQGRIVGIVMSGLFFGILLARTFSGIIGSLLGWRAMYLIASGMMLSLAWVLFRLLPLTGPASPLNYFQTLYSLGRLIAEQPILRETSLIGGLLFGSFSAFWSTLAFFIKQPPYHFGSETAGLFGLIGIAGSSFAPYAGRLADKKGPRLIAGAASLVALLGFISMWLFGRNLWGLIIGVILLDLGVQSAQISNQARVYSLNPEAKSRLNTIYMVTYFLGGALGSYLGMYAWSIQQWNGVCFIGTLMIVLSLTIWTVARFR